MKKSSFILLLAALCLCAHSAFAQTAVNVDRLNQLYTELAARPAAVTDSCRYTGSSFEGHGGFEWQRANGRGWTTGRRVTLKAVDAAEAARVRGIFVSYKSVLPHVNLGRPNGAATFEEATKTFYGYRYDEAEKTLSFLKASTPGEICIPIDWPTRTYLDATPKKPIAAPFIPSTDRERRLLGLSRLWAGIRQNFVFMDRVPFNWDSLYVAMIPQVIAAKDDETCIRLLRKMAASVRDGHTYVWSSNGDHPIVPAPFTTKLLEGRVYVDRILSTELKKQGLKRGMELLKIDGKGVFDYGRTELEPYVATSTPQWLEHQTYEVFNLTKKPKGQLLSLELKDGKKTLTLRYENGSAQWDLQQDEETVTYTLLPGNIGLLTIRSFMDAQVKEYFDKLYPQLLKTDALLIDIRDNGGGNSGNADYILRHLSKDSIRQDRWKSPMYVPALVSWNYPPQWYKGGQGYMTPVSGKPIYEKPIAVLVNAGTFSAAEDFCGVFKGMKRGVLVGSPTGGSTGNGVRIELIAGSAWANICSKHDTAPDGTEFVGHGFTPDIQVTETYQSYFKDKTDACISQALSYLKKLR